MNFDLQETLQSFGGGSIVDWHDIDNKPDFESMAESIHQIRLRVDEDYEEQMRQSIIKSYYNSIIMTDLWYELAKHYVSDKLKYLALIRQRINQRREDNAYTVGSLKMHPGAYDFEKYCYVFGDDEPFV